MANIKDVAREAGVVPSTVSNVFSNKKFVSDEVKNRVLEACRMFDYHPNVLASSLITKKTKVIGLFLTAKKNKFDAFYSDLICGVGLTAARHGYSPLLYFNIVDEQDVYDIFKSGRGLIDGAIILTPMQDDFRIDELKKDGLPFVSIGNYDYDNDNYFIVDAENERNTFTITKHLLERGHKKILFLNGSSKHSINKDRLSGFRNAFAEQGVQIDESLIFEVDQDNNDARSILKGFEGTVGFTACLAESDKVARPVYEFCASQQLAVGRDVAVASLGGDKGAANFTPELTSVYVDYKDVGKKSATLLIDILQNRISRDDRKKVINKSEIVFKQSSDFTL